MKQKERIDPKDNFLMQKYTYYLSKVIRRLGNRDNNADFFWKDNDFNLKNKSKSKCDELVIDDHELLKQFMSIAKENNIHEINLVLYKRALYEMTGKLRDFPGMGDFGDYPTSFFIERQMIGDNIIYKITFGAE